MPDLRERLAYLHRRASDPSSTENEREIAKTIAARLEDRLEREYASDPEWTSTGRVRHAVGPEEAPTGIDGVPVDAPWPDGWDGPRERIDYEMMATGDKAVISWDCPSCGGNVAKSVPFSYIYRMMGSRVDPMSAIRTMVDGRYNQLCDACTSRYAAKGD